MWIVIFRVPHFTRLSAYFSAYFFRICIPHFTRCRFSAFRNPHFTLSRLAHIQAAATKWPALPDYTMTGQSINQSVNRFIEKW